MPQISQNVTFEGGLPPDQAAAIAALLRGATQAEAAAVSGVSRETVSRWLNHDVAFIAAYRNARFELASQVRIELVTLGKDSVDAIRATLSDQTNPDLRFKAACKVLSWIVGEGVQVSPPTTAVDVEYDLREQAIAYGKRDLFCRIGEFGTKHEADDEAD